MLIRFVLENWMSFKDPTTFSMIATREKNHTSRLPLAKKYRTKILPVSALYGGNASGKTNFVLAFQFLKKFVLEGERPGITIPIYPYMLQERKVNKPTRFTLEILVDDTMYELDLVLTKTSIVYEKLTKISSAKETVIYERQKEITFAKSVTKTQKDKDFLHFVFQATRENQLFLTSAFMHNSEVFAPIYHWFNKLEIISPTSHYVQFELFFEESHPHYKTMNHVLTKLDTGIKRLGGRDISFDDLQLPLRIKNDIVSMLKDGVAVSYFNKESMEKFIFSRVNGMLHAKKLYAYHVTEEGKEIPFEYYQESDGTKRVIELLPGFIELSAQSKNKVYIIDELDRSLHTELTQKLLQSYLSTCDNQTRTQLLFTTHDLQLMDQELLRRDEMWLTERHHSGFSRLYSLSEYKDVRKDKDIRKSYLQGRLGGVPKITLDNDQFSCSG